MKYGFEPVVEAVYTPNPLSGNRNNPFLEAMPEMLSKEALFERLGSYPVPQLQKRGIQTTERRRALSALSSAFIPMDYMAAIYNTLFCAIESTYNTSTTIESIYRTHAIHQGKGAMLLDAPMSMSSDSGSILGVPGIGKSSTVRRCLRQIPQVILHSEYKGQKLFCKQITHLMVECPSDCSVKTLALNIIEAIDRAIGSDYSELSGKLSRLPSTSAMATRVKILCLTHHIGLIVIDEIQNAILTASRTKQDRPLIKFLVELSNEACTSIYFVGTPSAEELFLSQEHLKRRTRGLRLLPLRPDGVYRQFLYALWRYQYTQEQAPLTDALSNLIYDLSGGIPAYILKVFYEAQVQALQAGVPKIDAKLIRIAAEVLNISVPKTYAKGTYLSDFSISDTKEIEEELQPETKKETAEEEIEYVSRTYANTRGRPKSKRSPRDILTIVTPGGKAGEALVALKLAGLLEVFQCD
ncbi:MAG: ATP-binding protein [Methanocorpusculum sp.]|nr:ATP-binding protein [Oscillospiraceae bacterium]MBQ3569605.1 ATP-binding protein [Methanocorpusculum sp.]